MATCTKKNLTALQRSILRGLLLSVIGSLGPLDKHSVMLKSILVALG